MRSRKSFLLTVATLMVLMAPFAFGTGETEESSTDASGMAADTVYNESPLLTARVLSGDLPNVDERLPSNPFVREVAMEIGDYGGTIRQSSPLWQGYYQMFFAGGEMTLFQIPMDLNEYVAGGGPIAGFEPKYVEYYKWIDGGNTVEVRIRDGAKWSDGHPLTAEDIIFPFEEMYTNPGYTQRMISLLTSFNGERFKVTKVDDLTVRFTANGPWAGQIRETFEGYPKPAHFLKKFHPEFTDGKTWDDLRAAQSFIKTPELPMVWGWIPLELNEGQGSLWERNPYYPVVDVEGNQLPYADYVRYTYVPDAEARYLAIMQGDVDVCAHDCGDLNKRAVLMRNSNRGNYDVLIWRGSRQASMLSWRYPAGQEDAGFKEAAMHKQFRQALSIGMDRQEVNEKVFAGLAVPSVSGVSRNHASYTPVQDTYLGPDRNAALSLFAEIGITDSDGDGTLEYSNGEDVHIFVPAIAGQPLNVATAETVASEWNKLGIKTTLVTADGGTLSEKMKGGEMAFQISTGHPEYAPFHYLGIWHNRIEYGFGVPIEQPPEYDRAFELELEYAAATSIEEQNEVVRRFFDYVSTETLSWMHLVTDRPQQVIRHKCMGNVPDERVFQKFMMTAKVDQWFIKADCEFPRAGG